MSVSSQPRKQRKSIYRAPMHRRQKLMAARLSDELMEEHGRKSLTVRKGDTVELLRGDFQGHKGKVDRVDLKKGRLYIEGVTVQKADGTERFYPVHPSKVRIVKMEIKDEKREKSLSRTAKKEKKE